MQARRHGPISQAKRHGTSKWRLHLGLRRALLRQVGAWVFSLPDQMAYVLAIRVPLLRPSGMVHQTSSSGQEANDQKILYLPAEEVPLCRPGDMVPSLRPSGIASQ